MKAFYSETHRKHNPSFEVFDGGLRVPYLEVPERMDQILRALKETHGTEIIEPMDFELDPIYTVHDKEYIDFLASCWTEWLESEAQDQQSSPVDKSTLLPATFALRRHPQKPTSLLGRAGYYMMDLSACIVEGTYTAALASANCALSAAQVVANGERSAFALCRPPGHHAGKDYAGGYCFINNAAVAANWLSAKGNVALLDVDYHCGNGTQDVFYERADVLTISIHADPNVEYPYYWGYVDEIGAGAGLGYHKNFPLEKGADNARYLSALGEALSSHPQVRSHISGRLCRDGYLYKRSIGDDQSNDRRDPRNRKKIASLGLPTVIVMEGGYNNDALGKNILNFLGEFII